jgi:hypothetical protein
LLHIHQELLKEIERAATMKSTSFFQFIALLGSAFLVTNAQEDCQSIGT